MNFSTKYNTINNENINEMVIAFYTKVLNEDNGVSKVFKEKLGDDISSDLWQEHIVTLTKFWAMIALQDDEYKGSPLAPHFALPLKKEMFGEWLLMFFTLIDSMYAEKQATLFKTRAEDIAKNFMRVLDL